MTTGNNPGSPGNGAAPNRIPDSALETTLGSGWLDGVDGGDMNFDDLFGNPDVQTTEPPAPPVQAPSQAPPQEQSFMRTATGTVYKTFEDSIRGTEEKDRLIAQMRHELTELKGADPLKKTPPVQPVDEFGQFADRAYDRLVESVQKGDKRGYVQALAEIQQVTLAPYAPLMAEVARERAVRRAAETNPEIREFVGSPEYRSTLEHLPILQRAIQIAETDPGMAEQDLPELIRAAHLVNRGLRVVATAPNAKTTQAPNPRPTLTQSTPTPPTPQGDAFAGKSTDELLKTKEGRKYLIEGFERSGGADKSW